MKKNKRTSRRTNKEDFSSVVAIARAVLYDYNNGGARFYSPLEVCYNNKWVNLDKPFSWFGSTDWVSWSETERADVLTAELLDRLTAVGFKIVNIPTRFI